MLRERHIYAMQSSRFLSRVAEPDAMRIIGLLSPCLIIARAFKLICDARWAGSRKNLTTQLYITGQLAGLGIR